MINKLFTTFVVLLTLNNINAANNMGCAVEDEKSIRDNFEKFSGEITKQNGACYDITIRKDLKVFSTELATLNFAKGIACFQGGKSFVRINSPYTAELLLVNGQAFHNSGIPGNKKFIFSSNVSETKFNNLAKTLEKLSKDKLTVWSDYRKDWNCTSVEKTATESIFRFSPVKDSSAIDRLDFYFETKAFEPKKIVLYGPAGLNVDLQLTKTIDSSKFLPLPNSLQPLPGYEIQKTN